MKKSITFPLCLAIIQIFAQPTLNFNNAAVIIGSSYTSHTVAADLNEGSGGANMTWDFSNLPAGTVTTSEYLDPSETSWESSFPGANVATSAGGAAYAFASSNVYAYSFYGLYTGFNVVYYDDPEDYIRYPFTYGDEYVDELHSSYISGVAFERNGTMAVEADGWGTLILPWGTIENCLRIHATEIIMDDSDLFDLSTSTELYYWYSPGYHLVLLTSSAQSIDGDTPIYSYNYSAQVSSHVDITSALPTLDVFPNPTTGAIRINTDGGNGILEVFNARGKLVEQITLVSATATIDLAQLPAGLYLIALHNEAGSSVKHLVKM